MDSSSGSDRVQLEHEDLITGLHRFYRTLIHLAWLDEEDVQFPPHDRHGETSLATSLLLAAGAGRDAVELLICCPIPRHRHSRKLQGELRLTLDSTAVTYYKKDAEDGLMDQRRFGIGEEGQIVSLPPWALLVFGAPSRNDKLVIYDLRYKTLSELSIYEPTVRELEAAARPAADVLRTWNDKLRSLDWIPWRSSSRCIDMYVRPTAYEQELAMPDSLRRAGQLYFLTAPVVAGAEPLAASMVQATDIATTVNKASYNESWSRRLVLKSAGWPEIFDKQLCRRKIDEWEQGYLQVTNFRTHGPRAQMVGDMKEGRHLREFYREAAGKYGMV